MSYTFVEYVWIGGNYELRSKTRVLHTNIETINDLSNWNFDGSSTKQADGSDSEVILKPQALFNDPFRGGHHKMVLCDTYKPTGEHISNNHRIWAKELFDKNPVCSISGQRILSIDDCEVDHILPYSKGGKTDLSNAQLVLRYFNRAKSNNESYS